MRKRKAKLSIKKYGSRWHAELVWGKLIMDKACKGCGTREVIQDKSCAYIENVKKKPVMDECKRIAEALNLVLVVQK